jgi:hypothetical protein
VAGRVTLGLYNSYDPNHFHEAMRRAVARAAPLAAAFDYNLALFGFPFHTYKTKAGELPRPKNPQELAPLIAESTSIGEGGEYLLDLAKNGRFQSYTYPDRGFPPQLGLSVLATRDPDPTKRIQLGDLAKRVHAGAGAVVLIGLGPRGVPKRIHDLAEHHVELTGRGVSLETATAMGVLAGRLASALDSQYALRAPRLATDALVEKGDAVLLIRRGREPFLGKWALPGGFVDAGETCPQAVLRELREETGLVGRKPELSRVYDDPRRDPRFHTVTLVYRVAAEGEPRGGDDAAEAAFFPWGALPPLAFDHDKVLADHRPRP